LSISQILKRIEQILAKKSCKSFNPGHPDSDKKIYRYAMGDKTRKEQEGKSA
jgi:hypothetical protein